MTRTSGLMLKPEMILAYLAGIKTQTRRMKGLDVINKDPDQWWRHSYKDSGVMFCNHNPPYDTPLVRYPYGKNRDTLYFKETWRAWEEPEYGQDFILYRADNMIIDPEKLGWSNKPPRKYTDPHDFDYLVGRFDKWQPSMLMPMKCARLRDIPIVSVRIERLHDITEYDVDAEGFPGNPGQPLPIGFSASVNPVKWYFALWDQINPTMPASKNPWVFVYEFQKYDYRYDGERIIDA